MIVIDRQKGLLEVATLFMITIEAMKAVRVDVIVIVVQ